MSHNLTQPEEIDLIWMAMESHDMEVGTPIPDWAQLSGIIRGAKCYELAMTRIDHMVS